MYNVGLDFPTVTFPVDSTLSTRLVFSLAKSLGANFLLFQLIILLSGLLCGLLALAAQLFSRDMVQEFEKKSPYECGFFPFDSATRLPFDVHFYVVGIMFLVFDVELIILTTIIVLAAAMPWFALFNVANFVIVLTAGFAYEWSCGVLRWDAKTPEPITLPTVNTTSTSSMLLLAFFAADFSVLEIVVSPLFSSFVTLLPEFQFLSTNTCTSALSTPYSYISALFFDLSAATAVEGVSWGAVLFTFHFADFRQRDPIVDEGERPAKGKILYKTRRYVSRRRHIPRAQIVQS